MVPRALCLGLLLLVPSITTAQQSLRGRMQELFTFGGCGRPLCLDGSVSAANGHGDHFLPDLAFGNAAVIGFLTDAVALNAAAVPVAASASGVTYRFVGGLPVRTTESAGPIFAERAQTLGRGRLFVAAHLSGARLNTIRGTPLDRLVLNLVHQDVGVPGLGDPVLENDIIEVRLALFLNLRVTSLVATYGLSDRVDLGIAIPVVHTSLQGRSTAQIFPFGGDTVVHFFTGTPTDPGLRASAATFGSATGIGDVAVRLKANLHTDDRFAFAVIGDVRLPTGDPEDFSGSGHLALRSLALASARFGDFFPHINLGYLLRTGAGRNDDILLTAGFDQPVGNWATISAEMVSEWQTGENQLQLPGTVTYQFPFPRSIEPANIPDSKDHRVHGALGAKFRTSENGPILVASALVPVKRGGLQPAVMWTLGIDLTF